MMYDHVQYAPLHWIVHAAGAYCVASAWWTKDVPTISFVLLAVSLLFFALGLMFRYLEISDEGEFLAVRFGPIRLFGTRIRYSDMTSVEKSRSSVLDGWGIHYIPGRGTTFNLWGFDCAKLMVKGRTIRLGSDDADNLVAFLDSKIFTQEPAERAAS